MVQAPRVGAGGPMSHFVVCSFTTGGWTASPPAQSLLNKTFWEASIDNNISKRGEEEKAVHTRTHACSILVSLQ